MREKLLDLMKNEGLKPSQLAEMLEINPAGISHILAGRNKPGFDLLQKILRRFPRINPDWLLLDSAQMYRNDDGATHSISAARTAQTTTSTDGLFSQMAAGEIPFGSPRTDRLETASGGSAGTSGAGNPSSVATAMNAAIAAGKSGAVVQRIVVLYDDQTFETYTPTAR